MPSSFTQSKCLYKNRTQFNNVCDDYIFGAEYSDTDLLKCFDKSTNPNTWTVKSGYMMYGSNGKVYTGAKFVNYPNAATGGNYLGTLTEVVSGVTYSTTQPTCGVRLSVHSPCP